MDDVIVIGGGPAGSATAAFLSKLGHSVRLFEKERFPREHVGESLLPFCHPILKDLGVLDEMEKLFVRKPTVRFLSSDGTQATNWCFNHVLDDESALSFQVDRKYFDTLLLENAERLGTAVHQETRVLDVDYESDPGQVIVRTSGPDGEEQVHPARFLVDASGRSSFLSTRNRWRHADPDLERTALWAHWTGVKSLKGGLEEGASLIIYLGGQKRGWIWVFPLGKDHLTVGVVLDSFYLKEVRREAGRDWRTRIYLEELFESPFVEDLLQGAEMMDTPFVEGDYSYYSDHKYGGRFAMVGDSGRFIDPIFSSGVYLSLKSASLVSARLHRMLEDDDMDPDQLSDIYETIDGAYGLVHRMIRMYYDPAAVTFAEVGEIRSIEEHRTAMSAGHFFLAGDFFENNAKYHEFFDLLSAPKQFDRYKKLVIERREQNTDSCDLDEGTVIFPDEAYLRERFTARN